MVVTFKPIAPVFKVSFLKGMVVRIMGMSFQVYSVLEDGLDNPPGSGNPGNEQCWPNGGDVWIIEWPGQLGRTCSEFRLKIMSSLCTIVRRGHHLIAMVKTVWKVSVPP